MSHSVEWLVENRIIYMRHYGVVTGEDLQASSTKSVSMIAAGKPPVHLVTDATDTEKVNLGLQDLISIYKNVPHEQNLGWSVFISPSKLNRFFASVATQLTGSNTREFATLEEGIAFLTRIDESLPDIVLPGH